MNSWADGFVVRCIFAGGSLAHVCDMGERKYGPNYFVRLFRLSWGMSTIGSKIVTPNIYTWDV